MNETAGGNTRRALVVDDETALAHVVASYLEREGFTVIVSTNGLDAVTVARHEKPDVVVLDVMMPGLDGVETCRQIRTFSDAYVIMLTARADEVDTLVGLSVGADDYMTKPFSPRELVARVRAMLRRPRLPAPPAAQAVEPPPRVFGALEVRPLGRDVRLNGRAVAVTPIEFDLLDALTERPYVAFSRRQLVERVWGPNHVGDDHIVDVHLGHLRRKLGDDAASPRYIRTVRGVGYRMGSG